MSFESHNGHKLYLMDGLISEFDYGQSEYTAMFWDSGLPSVGSYGVEAQSDSPQGGFVGGYFNGRSDGRYILSSSGNTSFDEVADRVKGAFDVFGRIYVDGQTGFGRFLGTFEAVRVSPAELPPYPFETEPDMVELVFEAGSPQSGEASGFPTKIPAEL